MPAKIAVKVSSEIPVKPLGDCHIMAHYRMPSVRCLTVEPIIFGVVPKNTNLLLFQRARIFCCSKSTKSTNAYFKRVKVLLDAKVRWQAGLRRGDRSPLRIAQGAVNVQGQPDFARFA
jgi:hypothetical protein